jgi:hypothetical protein
VADFTAFLLEDAGSWDADVSVFVGPGAPTHSKGVLVAVARSPAPRAASCTS